ncbi:MAG: precorrin-6Y C5,15-methyltransferase (decarboxylating) subunit CbiT, partial [Pseudomonadota bacterium]
TFSLAAARMGWPLENVDCVGLHAAPLSRLKPQLARGARAVALLRDGDTVNALAKYLVAEGFEASRLTVLEALGGPREQITAMPADPPPETTFSHPVAVAIEVDGDGPAIARASGIEDGFFETDGQITKRPLRALALSALAPKLHETLWDIGGGSGSIAVEWLLAHPSTDAVSIEVRPDRAVRIRKNAAHLGVDRLKVIEGEAPAALDGLDAPDAIFIGGGLSDELLNDLIERAPGARLVAHAVTLETESLLTAWSARLGGDLTRIELSEAAPLGSKRGWKASYPITQWRATL